VTALAERWRAEAWENAVFPLSDDGSLFRNRPVTEASLSDPVTLPPFRPPLERFRSAKLTVLRSFTVEIDTVLDTDAAGVLVAHGDQGGGYLLAIDHGAPLLSYNAYGDMHHATGTTLTPGPHRLTLRVDELPELRWRIRLDIDDTLNAEIPSVPMLLGMAPFTGISIGYDYGGPIDWDLYEQHRSYRFTGGELLNVRYIPGAPSQYDRTILHEIGKAVAEIAD
jgi:arylsulfatase